jgi:threonine synthase
VTRGIVKPDAHICGILTGHLLKDPDLVVKYHRGELEGFRSHHANRPLHVETDLDAILEALSSRGVEEE